MGSLVDISHTCKPPRSGYLWDPGPNGCLPTPISRSQRLMESYQAALQVNKPLTQGYLDLLSSILEVNFRSDSVSMHTGENDQSDTGAKRPAAGAAGLFTFRLENLKYQGIGSHFVLSSAPERNRIRKFESAMLCLRVIVQHRSV